MAMSGDLQGKIGSIKKAVKRIKRGFERAALSDDEKENYIKMLNGVSRSLQTTDVSTITPESVNNAAIALTMAQGLLKQNEEAFVTKKSLMDTKIKLRATKEREAQANELARVDPLTKIPNRRGFEENANQLFKLYTREELDELAILFIDVKKFKTINDTLGHSIGDDALVRIADLLEETARDADIVGRFAGDEFIIACPGEHPEILRERLYRAFDNATLYVAPNRVDRKLCPGKPPKTIPLSVDIGLAQTTKSTESLGLLIKEADSDMYQEKNHQRTRIPLATDSVNPDHAPG